VSRGSSATRHSPRWATFSGASSHEALLKANTVEDLPGKWQAAIVKAEQNRPRLRVVRDG
jgi:hypothetical protein